MADDFPTHAPIVVFMLDGPAATLIIELLRDCDVAVMIRGFLSVDDPPAGRLLAREVGTLVHGSLISRLGTVYAHRT